MLTKSPYVRVIALYIDFSKVLDTIRHCTLLHKLSTISIPDEVYNWIRDFFDNRSHCTKLCGEFSDFIDILTSVIQGSVIGPASYVVHAGDLRPITESNGMVKYADDTYLIVPGDNSHSCEDELKHQWAAVNNLHLNQSKTVEIIFSARCRRGNEVEPPPTLPNIERVSGIKSLGVTISNQLSMSGHVTSLLNSCASVLYALRTLRAHGMRQDSCMKSSVPRFWPSYYRVAQKTTGPPSHCKYSENSMTELRGNW